MNTSSPWDSPPLNPPTTPTPIDKDKEKKCKHPMEATVPVGYDGAFRCIVCGKKI